MAKSRGRLFFAAECDPSAGSAVLCEEEARHAYRILRLRDGAEIGVLFEGRRYSGVLEGGCAVRLTGPGETQPGPRAQVLLGVGRPKGQAASAAVEAATALGAAEITFIQTERSVARGAEGREKWRRAAREACKQCGRYAPPAIVGPSTLSSWVDRMQTAPVRLRLSESGGASEGWMEAEIGSSSAVAVLCGPEGGLSSQEETAADEAGFRPISLGPLVLRVELAIAAIVGRLAPWIWAPDPAGGVRAARSETET